MNKKSEEILADIDATIDQLIENAGVLNGIPSCPLFHTEIEAMQKTQESLLARLIHMQEHLRAEKQPSKVLAGIEKKAIRFGKLNNKMIHHFSHQMKKIERSSKPRIGRNRKKD